MSEIYRQQFLLTRPAVKKLTKLDKAMADILAADLHPFTKMEKYHAALREFMNTRDDVVRHGTNLQPRAMPQIQSSSNEDSGDDDNKNAIETLINLINSLIPNVVNAGLEDTKRKISEPFVTPVVKTKKKKMQPANWVKKYSQLFSSQNKEIPNIANDDDDAVVHDDDDDDDDDIFLTPSKNDLVEINKKTPVVVLEKLPPSAFTAKSTDAAKSSNRFKIDRSNEIDKSALTNLFNQISRNKGFKQNDNSGEITLNNEKISSQLWDKTMKLIMSKKITQKSIPDEIIDTAGKIYSFMVKNALRTEPYVKKYPFFRQIANINESTTMDGHLTRGYTRTKAAKTSQRKLRSQQGYGIGYKIHWKKWDNNVF